MVKVALEDKDFAERKPYFDVGVHEVYITGAHKVEPQTGSPYIEVTVLGDEDTTDDIRVYISEAAAPYTIANLARIAVHNAPTDEAKEKAKVAFKAITDTDMIDDKFLTKFENMQAWIKTEENLNAPKENGGYFLRSSLYSWEPKEPKMTPEQLMGVGTTQVDPKEVPFE